MDSILSSLQHDKPTAENSNSNKTHEHKTSTSELFASAKVLAEAAKGSGGEKLDKAKVADAAGDLLCGASQYGKLDENSALGKYVNKAEEYLHHYNKSSSSSPAHSSATNSSHSNPNTNTSHSSSATTHSSSGSQGGDGQAESGGYGDYMKMAEGLFKKH